MHTRRERKWSSFDVWVTTDALGELWLILLLGWMASSSFSSLNGVAIERSAGTAAELKALPPEPESETEEQAEKEMHSRK